MNDNMKALFSDPRVFFGTIAVLLCIFGLWLFLSKRKAKRLLEATESKYDHELREVNADHQDQLSTLYKDHQSELSARDKIISHLKTIVSTDNLLLFRDELDRILPEHASYVSDVVLPSDEGTDTYDYVVVTDTGVYVFSIHFYEGVTFVGVKPDQFPLLSYIETPQYQRDALSNDTMGTIVNIQNVSRNGDLRYELNFFNQDHDLIQSIRSKSKHLTEYLSSKGIDCGYVKSVLVFVEKETQYERSIVEKFDTSFKDSTWIITQHDLQDFVVKIDGYRTLINEATRTRIMEALSPFSVVTVQSKQPLDDHILEKEAREKEEKERLAEEEAARANEASSEDIHSEFSDVEPLQNQEALFDIEHNQTETAFDEAKTHFSEEKTLSQEVTDILDDVPAQEESEDAVSTKNPFDITSKG